VVDPEVASYVGDGAAGVGDHPGTAIEQLIGVFLLSWHGLGVPFFQVGILVSGSPSNLAWLTALDASTERIIEYLADYVVPINVVVFRYLKDNGAEYLARSWLTSPTEVEGRTSKKKRPWNGRDFYISFGVNEHDERQWEDARRHGFVSAGGGVWYSRTLNALEPGNRVFVHIPGEGYVGAGVVVESAQPVADFITSVDGQKMPILDDPGLTATNMSHDVGDAEKDEFLVRIDWLKTYPREDAFWEQGLFANQNSAVKLRDTHTIKRLEEHFGLKTRGEGTRLASPG